MRKILLILTLIFSLTSCDSFFIAKKYIHFKVGDPIEKVEREWNNNETYKNGFAHYFVNINEFNFIVKHSMTPDDKLIVGEIHAYYTVKFNDVDINKIKLNDSVFKVIEKLGLPETIGAGGPSFKFISTSNKEYFIGFNITNNFSLSVGSIRYPDGLVVSLW